MCIHIADSLCYTAETNTTFFFALGLCCCARAFSSYERGLLFVAVRGLLITVASLVVEHGLRRTGFSSCGSWALERRLRSCGTWA